MDKPMINNKPPEIGAKAPDFTLPSTMGEDNQISLSDFKGHPVILVFYPADWSPVCGDQIALYNEIMPSFEEHDAVINRHISGEYLLPPGVR
jgi:peroxiredoxin